MTAEDHISSCRSKSSSTTNSEESDASVYNIQDVFARHPMPPSLADGPQRAPPTIKSSLADRIYTTTTSNPDESALRPTTSAGLSSSQPLHTTSNPETLQTKSITRTVSDGSAKPKYKWKKTDAEEKELWREKRAASKSPTQASEFK